MPSAALLVLSASLWAACDFARKRALSRYSVGAVQRAGALGQAVLSVALLLGHPLAWPSARYWPFGIGAAVVSTAGSYCFLLALHRGSLSTTIPLLALTPAITALASWVALGQHLSPSAIAGLALVLTGSFVANPLRQIDPAHRSAFLWMTATAFLWSLGSTLDAKAVHNAPVPVHGLLCSLVAYAASFALKSVSPPPTESSRVPWLWICASLCAGAAVVQWFALAQSPAGIVEGTKRALGTLSALALGAWLFHERLGWRRIVGALCLLIGALFLSAGPR